MKERREEHYRPTTSSFGNCLVMEMSFNSFSIRRMFSLQSVATCIRSTSCVSVSVESKTNQHLVLMCQSNQYLVLVSVESTSCISQIKDETECVTF